MADYLTKNPACGVFYF